MSNTIFTQDNLNDGKPPLARAVAGGVGIVLLTFSALTSGAFFYHYAGSVFSFITPSLSPLISAVVGVMVFEGMSVAWRWLKLHDADSERQLSIASLGSWLSLAGGVMVTIVYFGLQSTLLVGMIDSTTIMTLNVLGAVLMVVGVSGGFALYHFYADSSSANLAASNAATLRAVQTTAQHEIDLQTATMTMAQTIAQIKRELPTKSRLAGSNNANEYISHYFGDGDGNGISLVNLGDGPNPKRPNGRG